MSHRFLLCPPEHVRDHFLYGDWTRYTPPLDNRRAWAQWRRLVATLTAAGAEIDLMPPPRLSCPAVFTADAAFIYAPRRALLLRNDGPRGALEPPHVRDWLQANGFQTGELAPDLHLDGGNLLRLHDGALLLGLKPGTPDEAARRLRALLRRLRRGPVLPVPLADDRFLHLDLVLGRLAGRGYLLYRDGLTDGPERRALESVLAQREVIEVSRADVERFACNLIAVGDLVITGPISAALTQRITRLSLRVRRLNLSEFFRLGGGAKCLTLPLDLT